VNEISVSHFFYPLINAFVLLFSYPKHISNCEQNSERQAF